MNIKDFLKSYNHIVDFAKKSFECSAHDFDHTLRVLKIAVNLPEFKNSNAKVLIPAVLLHDISRAEVDNNPEIKESHASLGSKRARLYLHGQAYDEKTIQEICHCIETHNFKGKNKPLSLEAKMLYDADKIDGLGAIGIARLFAMSGRYGSSLYDYENNSKRFVAPNTIFYSKQVDMINKLHLESSKEVAKERVDYMKAYFERLAIEVEL